VASSAPDQRTGKEEVGSQEYFKRHYFDAIFEKGWSFSGFERDKVFINKADGSFVDISGVSGADSASDGRGVAFADYDNDGDVDIFLHTIQRDRHLLFRNDVGNEQAWVRLDLEGTKSNTDAIGAVVTLTAGDKRLARIVSAGSGYLSSHDHRLLFGLGDADAAESIEVRWPSGDIQVFRDLPARTSFRILEGNNQPEVVHYPTFELADPPPPLADGPLVAEGDDFPAMKLTDLDGGAVAIDSFRSDGEAVLVNLWATWCKACKHEMPVLERLAQDYAACVKVVGVSLDFDEHEKVKRYAHDMGVTYPLIVTDSESPLEIFREDQILLPASFLVEKSGEVSGVWVGGSDSTLDDLEDQLRQRCARPHM